ncbi:GH15 family glucan-1,4-alpha-glucosidase [Friedmanniella endophytica]|uniref:GH15 family glucan-1,4-alpha-glucosidase n=1 Tax=Microlunatus kandeliicorticis TaxID=1759536 RepID=A0A7W3P5R6_9ACTN|nr:glycoside hydrolase family 15 protein [Microlunatus kandeliicorticis]MBA8794157.1 GH15 family glucan-1,4-alpha-glucosidase [Microlunatus kandeliicorticis]
MAADDAPDGHDRPGGSRPARDVPLPIADHGLIGDLRTAALVGSDGTIDWFCARRFDAPSVFAALLDDERGGAWRLSTRDDPDRTQQFYFPDSAILITRFLTAEGVAEVHDFMPVLRPHDTEHRQRLVRRVVGVRGKTALRTVVAARPGYGHEHPETEQTDDGVLIGTTSVRLGLSATVPLQTTDGDVTADFALSEGESALFVLEVLDEDQPVAACDPDDTHELFDATSRFWRSWLAQSTYTGRWRETVQRSALTLKLLTHEPTGAVIAAPTTSLPEVIGGNRNWDYRYVWIRDAAFTLYALLHLGFTDEAGAFMTWLSERIGQDPKADGDLGPLRVLYDIDGNAPDGEHALDHLRGYAGSRPVRVGNAAVDQLQLDIYGELIDSVYLFNKYGPGISADAWNDLTRALEWLMEHWDAPDAGMWEIRGDPQPHTVSRLMCWVAVERMIRIARQRGLPGDLSHWTEVRDRIYRRVMDDCWNPDLCAFVAREGGDSLDAGVLLMPMLKFVAPNDPRFVSTLRAIEDRLVSDSLVFRYDPQETPDGLDDDELEGTFSLCSFWYVEALTRVGRLDEAQLALEKMFTYANHLGLYAEQIGMTGEQLGNFPQAFTHLALISAATNLDRKLA